MRSDALLAGWAAVMETSSERNSWAALLLLAFAWALVGVLESDDLLLPLLFKWLPLLLLLLLPECERW